MAPRKLKRKNTKKRGKKLRKTRRIQRGGNLIGLLDNADGVPISQQQPIELHVKFGPASSDSASEYGSTLTIEEAQPEPHAYWTAPPASVLYTIVCWDPDAPAKSWLHWLVMNCAGTDPTSGNIIVDWAPPSPPRKSGLHRYIFGLFQQAAQIPPPHMTSQGGFNMASFAGQNQLTPLVYKGIRIDA
jgi:phosphatidylethanolamine-binding protein (PEBP) family uncharacterized protein